MNLTESDALRFWSKVAIAGPDDCWEWQASRRRHGYGQMSSKRGRSPYKAHRVAYALTKGDPAGFDVLHSCDNPPCCNPRHLSLGTARENAREMVTRGRFNPSSLGNLRPGAPGHHGAGPRSNRELARA